MGESFGLDLGAFSEIPPNRGITTKSGPRVTVRPAVADQVLASGAKVHCSRGVFGPAAAFALADSLQFEQPVLVAIVWLVEVLWRGLLGCQPLPVAGAAFEPESGVVSQVVVMATQSGQVPKGGLAVLDRGDDPVVDLEALSHVTAGDDTGLVPFDQRSPEGGPNGSAQVGDRGDVSALGDDELHDGVAQQLPGRLDGDGTNAGDLTTLGLFKMSPAQGGKVHSEVHAGRRGKGGRGPPGGVLVAIGLVGGGGVGGVGEVGGVAGHVGAFVPMERALVGIGPAARPLAGGCLITPWGPRPSLALAGEECHQGVGPVGVGVFSEALSSGLVEEDGAGGFEGSEQPGPGVGGEAALQAKGPVPVGVVAEEPGCPEALVGGPVVLGRSGPGPGPEAPVGQLPGGLGSI